MPARIAPLAGAAVWDHGPMIESDRLLEQLACCCADAGLDESRFSVLVVSAPRPPGTTPLAYLHPGGAVRSDTVAVFRAAATAAASVSSSHRLALWQELPGLPAAALGPMLRHEVEHARQYEWLGPSFFEADDLLRRALRTGGGSAYARLP